MPKDGKRHRKDITLESDVYEWVQEQVRRGRFFNFSHACEYGLKKLMQESKE